MDPDPWICIFLRIQIPIQEAKILRIKQILILIIEFKCIKNFKCRSNSTISDSQQYPFNLCLLTTYLKPKVTFKQNNILIVNLNITPILVKVFHKFIIFKSHPIPHFPPHLTHSISSHPFLLISSHPSLSSLITSLPSRHIHSFLFLPLNPIPPFPSHPIHPF